jgi:hypothetical protein
MQLLISPLMVTLAGLQGQTAPASSDIAKWPRFRDESHRVSFAYPTGLHPVNSPTEEFRGLDGWMSRVLIVDDNPGGTEKLPVLAVSVFVCDDPALDPRVPCVDDKWYRKVCDRFEKFPVGDATAIQCVTYGRAACQWSAVVLRDKGKVEISAPATARDAQLRTNTRAACADAVVAIRTQPLLRQVLWSFRYRRAD